MAAEALATLVRLNIVASVAIALVFLLRPAVRRSFGAHKAYALWLIVPLTLATAGAPIPLLEASGPVGPLEAAEGRAEAWLSTEMHSQALAAVWALGLFVGLGLVAWRYTRFLAQDRAGLAGPAIFGVFMPRLVTPADFAVRFTPEERRLVRAHERAHMDRLDARWNALALALQVLNWFNPLVHIAARAMRFDQELACDATVMERFPAERRRYAETLLRCQETIVSPLGCGWTGVAARPLATRLTVLMQPRPGEARHSLGDFLLATLLTATLAAACGAQPPYRLPEAVANRDRVVETWSWPTWDEPPVDLRSQPWGGASPEAPATRDPA